MAVSSILMPKLGLTMTEGVLSAWHVAAGDTVKAGDLLFVVETDKIATDVEARGDGRIEEIRIAEGETVDVGTVVATWTGPGAENDSSAASLPVGAASERAEQEATQSSSRPSASDGAGGERRIVATPVARRLAAANGIALSDLVGSGPRGRIKSQDVLSLIGDRNAGNTPSSPQRAAPAAPACAASSRRAASSFEKTVARRLTDSKQQIPHFYVMAEADLTSLIAFRTQLNTDGQVSKISLNHMIVLAVGRALRKHPEMTVVWDDSDVVALGGTDVGFAVDTPRGLLAPVLRSVGDMRIDQLALAADAAALRAREGRTAGEELSGGVITVSNVGMFGAAWLVPIINPGQSAIIGVGAAQPQFRPDSNGAPTLRHILSLTLSGDHRVLDGVKGAQFLASVARLLEQPLQLLR